MATTKWWRITAYNELQYHDVVRETEKWLFFPLGRALKRSRSGRWFATRDEAVEHARERLTQNVRNAKWQLRHARTELVEFNAREAKLESARRVAERDHA